MPLTRQLTLTALVIALGAGVAACNKKEPTPSETLGENVGSAQQRIEEGWDNTRQSTIEVLDNAADKMEAAGDRIQSEVKDAQADFEKGRESGK